MRSPLMRSAVTSAWDSYKLRLAALARQQGVREVDDPGQRAGPDASTSASIELERTEPVARSSGGVVGALAPYLRVARHRAR